MVQVMAAVGHLDLPKIPEARTRFGMGFVTHPQLAPQLRLGRLNPEGWRTDPPPGGDRLGAPIQNGIDTPMSRIPRETDTAMPVGFAQVFSEKGCLCVGQARIVRLQSRRQRGPVGVGTEARRRAQFMQPFLESPRRQFGAAVRQPERVQRCLLYTSDAADE